MADDFWDAPENPEYSEPNEEQEAWKETHNRWSYHLANDPFGGEVGAWARQYYDNPNIDPGEAIQRQIGAFRNRFKGDAPEDDASVLQMIATGQRPQPKQQTPAEAWNATPTKPVATGPERAPIDPNTTLPGIPAAPGAPGGPSPAQESDRQFLDLLMKRAQQGTAIGREDLNVRAQVDPLTAQMTRASRDYLDQLAESGRGAPINLMGEQRMVAERLGQQAGALESEVIGREIGARRQEIQDALAMWGGKLEGEQGISLQRELGYLNDRARAAQLAAQQRQFESQEGGVMERFMRELALREWESKNQDWYRRAGI